MILHPAHNIHRLEADSVTQPDSNHDAPIPPDSKTATRYSIGFCPICGGGLCSIRACGLVDDQPSYGLVLCDECEAMWLQPDLKGVHLYPDSETPLSPIDQTPLYEAGHRWATLEDIDQLGWMDSVNADLTYQPESKDS